MATTRTRRTAQQIAADAQAAYRASLVKQRDKFEQFAADWADKADRYGVLTRDAQQNHAASLATARDLMRQIAQLDAAAQLLTDDAEPVTPVFEAMGLPDLPAMAGLRR